MTSESNQPQKTPKPVRLLKRLRDVIGKTQREMAKMVGISLSLWKQKERGRGMNLKLAQRISYATGHSATELHERPYGRLLQKDCRSPYTRESYEQYLDKKKNFRFSGIEAHSSKSNMDPLLNVEDLADADLLRSKLRHGSVVEFLKDKLSRDTLAKISGEWDEQGSKELLLKDLNRIIREKKIIYDDWFSGIPLSVETAELLDQFYKGEEKVSGKLLNRMLLEDAFPQELKKLSERTIPPPARGDAERVGELATCMVLAAGSRGKPQEKAINAAISQALAKIRKDFDLEFLTYDQFVRRTSKATVHGLRRNEKTGKEEWKYMVCAVEAPGMLVSSDPRVGSMRGLHPGIPNPKSDTGNPHEKKAQKAVPPSSRHNGKGKASPSKTKRRKKR
jgi:transcriptional regulator with XRE-family HTH domain